MDSLGGQDRPHKVTVLSVLPASALLDSAQIDVVTTRYPLSVAARASGATGRLQPLVNAPTKLATVTSASSQPLCSC
jgi:hypothetical protein